MMMMIKVDLKANYSEFLISYYEAIT